MKRISLLLALLVPCLLIGEPQFKLTVKKLETDTPPLEYDEIFDRVGLEPLSSGEKADLWAKYYSTEEFQLVPTQKVAPRYPESMAHGDQGGEVVLYIVVLKSGKVGGVYVGDYSHIDFAKSALIAYARWAFEPIPHANLVEVPVTFNAPRTE